MDWQQKFKELTKSSWLAIALLIANIIAFPLFIQNGKPVYVDLTFPTLVSLGVASSVGLPEVTVTGGGADKIRHERAAGEVSEVLKASLSDQVGRGSPVAVNSGASSSADSDGNSAGQTKASVAAECYAVSLFSSPSEMMKIERLLIVSEFEVSQHEGNNSRDEAGTLGYWVFFPPLASRALGRLKVEEFRLKGFREAVLLTNDQPLYAISLGVFHNERLAHMELMKAQSLGFNVKMDIRSADRGVSMLHVSRQSTLNAESIGLILKDHNEIKIEAINCR